MIRQEDEEEEADLQLRPDDRVKWRTEEERPNKTLDEKTSEIELKDMKEINPNLVRFTFDHVKGEWCEVVLEVNNICVRNSL